MPFLHVWGIWIQFDLFLSHFRQVLQFDNCSISHTVLCFDEIIESHEISKVERSHQNLDRTRIRTCKDTIGYYSFIVLFFQLSVWPSHLFSWPALPTDLGVSWNTHVFECINNFFYMYNHFRVSNCPRGPSAKFLVENGESFCWFILK